MDQSGRIWRSRLGWFLLAWAAGVLALAAFAGILKFLMSLAGLTV